MLWLSAPQLQSTGKQSKSGHGSADNGHCEFSRYEVNVPYFIRANESRTARYFPLDYMRVLLLVLSLQCYGM